jgi:predicted phosphodiesterase
MRICVFSDIHGNGPAFRNALKMIKKEGADLNIFLGDLCGYYFDQEEIWQEIITLPSLVACIGNHDRIFLKILEGDEVLRKDYRERYGHSLEYLLEERNNDMIMWFSEIPQSYVCPSYQFAAFHGAPWDPMEGYVYPDSQPGKFLDESASIFFLGHTHYPMEKIVGNKLVINPGSLGQPRNGGWPTYAVVDLSTREVLFRKVPYDKAKLMKQIDERDSNPYLKTVLFQ